MIHPSGKKLYTVPVDNLHLVKPEHRRNFQTLLNAFVGKCTHFEVSDDGKHAVIRKPEVNRDGIRIVRNSPTFEIATLDRIDRYYLENTLLSSSFQKRKFT